MLLLGIEPCLALTVFYIVGIREVIVLVQGELALEQIASKRFPLELITTHKFGLKDVDLAIRSVGNEGVPDVIHASLMPWE